MERWSIARMEDGSFALTCDERYTDEFESAFSALTEAILKTTDINGLTLENIKEASLYDIKRKEASHGINSI